MPVTPIADTIAGTAANGGSTSAIDSSTANFLAVVVAWYSGGGGTPTVSDSYGNTWTPLTTQTDPNGLSVRIYYSAGSPTAGTGHTFTVSGTSIFATIWAAVFSVVTSSPFDQESGQVMIGATVEPGSITPSGDGRLLITGMECGDTVSGVDSGFTGLSVNNTGGQYVGGGGAYLVQTSAAAVNPSWTYGGGNYAAAVMASFLPAAGGATGTSGKLLLLGVG